MGNECNPHKTKAALSLSQERLYPKIFYVMEGTGIPSRYEEDGLHRFHSANSKFSLICVLEMLIFCAIIQSAYGGKKRNGHTEPRGATQTWIF